jgi:hypothetical protein
MSSEMRRARGLALLLDLLLPAAIADLAALSLTAALWFLAPGRRGLAPWIWAAAAAAATLGFLLRDTRGGRARRWLALEVRDGRGAPPGAWGSIRRNLPLLLPIWNLAEAWPVLRDGGAARPADRGRGYRVVSEGSAR